MSGPHLFPPPPFQTQLPIKRTKHSAIRKAFHRRFSWKRRASRNQNTTNPHKAQCLTRTVKRARESSPEMLQRLQINKLHANPERVQKPTGLLFVQCPLSSGSPTTTTPCVELLAHCNKEPGKASTPNSISKQTNKQIHRYLKCILITIMQTIFNTYRHTSQKEISR